MADIQVKRDGELMVAHFESDTDAGVKFLDSYFPDVGYTVVDSGRIIVHTDGADALVAAAKKRGLTVETV